MPRCRNSRLRADPSSVPAVPPRVEAATPTMLGRRTRAAEPGTCPNQRVATRRGRGETSTRASPRSPMPPAHFSGCSRPVRPHRLTGPLGTACPILSGPPCLAPALFAQRKHPPEGRPAFYSRGPSQKGTAKTPARCPGRAIHSRFRVGRRHDLVNLSRRRRMTFAMAAATDTVARAEGARPRAWHVAGSRRCGSIP